MLSCGAHWWCLGSVGELNPCQGESVGEGGGGGGRICELTRFGLLPGVIASAGERSVGCVVVCSPLLPPQMSPPSPVSVGCSAGLCWAGSPTGCHWATQLGHWGSHGLGHARQRRTCPLGCWAVEQGHPGCHGTWISLLQGKESPSLFGCHLCHHRHLTPFFPCRLVCMLLLETVHLAEQGCVREQRFSSLQWLGDRGRPKARALCPRHAARSLCSRGASVPGVSAPLAACVTVPLADAPANFCLMNR